MMRIIRNEKGIALVVSLVMLALLTILGTFALSTSSTELLITGNYRNYQYAFYAADAGIEHGKRIVLNHQIAPGNAQSCDPVPPAGKTCATDKDHVNKVDLSSTETYFYRIDWIRTGRPPAGFADDEVVADYFAIRSLGEGPVSARVELESLVVLMRNISE